MRTAGIGIDLVHIPEFAEQLAVPGSQFAEVFSPAERRLATRRAAISGAEVEHLAARWAAKESFVKAWSAAIIGQPPVIDPAQFNWQHVEVLADRWDRPFLALDEELEEAVVASIRKTTGEAGTIAMQTSLTHDGDYAQAIVHLLCQTGGK